VEGVVFLVTLLVVIVIDEAVAVSILFFFARGKLLSSLGGDFLFNPILLSMLVISVEVIGADVFVSA